MLRSAALALPLLGAVSAAPAWIPASSIELSKRQSDNSTGTGEAFIQCLNDAKLDAVVEGSDSYANDSAAFNSRFEYKPVALVYPNKTEDVSAAVKCASQNGIKVNARSGGHSYAAYALGGEDGHLTVSLDNLRDLTVDGEKASIGAGNRVGDILLGLYNQGKRALAHATCPYVGIGGQAAHGGFGLPSRAWGMLLDQVYEVEVVTAEGEVVTANKEENGELFWAIRGAGSSFGIVTTWKTTTHPAPEHNVWASYTWYNFTAEEASDAIQKWQAFSVDTPPELGLQIHINSAGENGNTFVIDGVWYGDDGVEGSNATFAPLLEQLSAPNETTIQDQNWLDSAALLAGVGSPEDLDTTKAPDTHDTFFAGSIMVPESAPMTEKASKALTEYMWSDLLKTDLAFWFIILDLYGGTKSYIRNVPADETSFDIRDSLYSIQFYGSSGAPPFPEDGVPLVKGMISAVTDNQPETKFKGYANYVDSELSREEAHSFYYPTHTEKLEDLKATWDPKDVFSFPQSFLPAGSA